MSGFPDKFRDLTAFSGDGLDYSTTSNTAVKMFDALVNQVRVGVLTSPPATDYLLVASSASRTPNTARERSRYQYGPESR